MVYYKLTYMEDIEIWKNINNYENYEVSSLGNVRNKKTGRILKHAIIGGYYCVGLSNSFLTTAIFFSVMKPSSSLGNRL